MEQSARVIERAAVLRGGRLLGDGSGGAARGGAGDSGSEDAGAGAAAAPEFEVYDDADFYEQLLKEFIATDAVGGSKRARKVKQRKVRPGRRRLGAPPRCA